MSQSEVFISHTSADDGFVKQLRVFLERLGQSTWVDSRRLRGGDKLDPVIKQAIEAARAVIAVISPKTINSPWVKREIE
jgi:TIR domain